MTDRTLDDLALAWREAKREESVANARRIDIEQKILEITGCREEGSETITTDTGLKITVTGKLNRTLDAATWAELESVIPEALRPVVYKPSLELKGLRYLENNEPDIFAIVSKAITTKPAKPSISIKE